MLSGVLDPELQSLHRIRVTVPMPLRICSVSAPFSRAGEFAGPNGLPSETHLRCSMLLDVDPTAM